MPTYQYRCKDCGDELEVIQKFTDDALTECPACEGTLRKVFNAVGVVFKGSGFYRTDSRGSSKDSASSTAPASGSGSSTESSGGAKKTESSASSPAPAAAAAS